MARQDPPQITFEKVIYLFTDKDCTQLYSRQANAITQLCRKYQDGWNLGDLRHLTQILGFIEQQLQHIASLEAVEEEEIEMKEGLEQRMEEALLSLLKVSSLPFRHQKMSEPQRETSSLADFLTSVSSLLLPLTRPARTLAALTVLRSTCDNSQGSAAAARRLAWANSSAAVSCAALLQYLSTLSWESSQSSHDGHLPVHLLRELVQLSVGALQTFAESKGELWLEETVNALLDLCEKVTSELLESVLQLLWTFWELHMESIVKVSASKVFSTFLRLRKVLENEEETLRVVLLLLTSLLLRHPPHADTLTCHPWLGVIRADLGLLLKEGGEWEELHTILHVLLSLARFPRGAETVEGMEEWQTCVSFLSSQTSHTSQESHWAPHELRQLRAQVLRGAAPLLALPTAPRGLGELLVQAVGGGDREVRSAALESFLGSGNGPALEPFIPSLTTALLALLPTQIPENLAAQVLSALALLLNSSPTAQRIALENGGVAPLLQWVPSLPPTSPTSERIVYAAVTCLWVLGPVEIEAEGVDALLTLLSAIPSPRIQALLLGCLADWSQWEGVRERIRTWRSSQGLTTWSLLAILWREEETRRGVPRTSEGFILNLSDPLEGTHSLPEDTPDIRWKVYAVLTSLGTLPSEEALYGLDRATLLLAEKCLVFGLATEREKVLKQLEERGVKVVPKDRKALAQLREETLQLAVTLRTQQTQCLHSPAASVLSFVPSQSLP